MAQFEVVFRGGSIVDGTGTPKYTADVGIRDGRIAEIGRVSAHNGQADHDNTKRAHTSTVRGWERLPVLV
jgi:N-acyl-D-aspartate/D-glutamate deacylase